MNIKLAIQYSVLQARGREMRYPAARPPSSKLAPSWILDSSAKHYFKELLKIKDWKTAPCSYSLY